jgi:hypothetical protein
MLGVVGEHSVTGMLIAAGSAALGSGAPVLRAGEVGF